MGDPDPAVPQPPDTPPKGHRWIDIPKWDKYQHPDTTRGLVPPPWIKLYTHTLHDADYQRLSEHCRLLFLHLLLTYASTRRQVPDVTAWLTRRTGVRVMRRDLDALNHAGLIAYVASKPLARRKQVASLEEEVLRTSSKKRARASSRSPHARARPDKNTAAAAAADVCPHCEVGAGQHTTDCPTLTRPSANGPVTDDDWNNW